MALISDVDNIEEGHGALTLMTFHAAKGLEFPHVFLSGAEEGLLPHERSKESDDQIEEERRLFYVGITRSQKTLTVSFCRKRMINGQYSEVTPSRFLAESGLRGRTGFSASRIFTRKPERKEPITNFDLGKLKAKALINKKQISRKNSEENDTGIEETVQFERGNIVHHPQFGPGRVEEITSRGASGRIKIFFRHYGVKSLRYDIAVKKLTRISDR